jgi:oligopeptide/dipeptide ABC transporter ATP-binding protein
MTAVEVVNVEPFPDAHRPIIELTDVKVHFPVKRGTVIRREVGVVRAVDGVSLRVDRGRTLALVGESGSGKTTLGRAIMGMVPITEGFVKVDGRDATATRRGQLPHIVQIVLQDPFGSLDPRMPIERVISEPLRVGGADKRPAMDPHERVTELLELVGLPSASRKKYPHQFSGGQRQRIAIARALAPNPQVVVLDEPTSALDVSVQAQILNLLQDLQRELGHAYVLISHNLVTVAHVADMVAVMYLGRIVEVGTPDQIFRNPQHPYTRALLESIPSSANLPPVETLRDAPSPMHEYIACRYRSQCRLHRSLGRPAECVERDPVLRQIESEHMAACHFPGHAVTDGAKSGSETTDSGQIE